MNFEQEPIPMPRARLRRFRACHRKRARWKKSRVDRRVGGDPVNGVDRDGRYIGESWVRKGKNFVSDNAVGLTYAYFTGDYGGALGIQKGHNVSKAQGYSVGSADYFKTVGAAWAIQSTANLVGVMAGQACATCGIAAASTISSIGDAWLMPGQDVSTSFGAFSVNWSSGDVGYLGERGNTWQENLGYGLGALANLGDGAKLIGHFSSLNDPMPINGSAEDQIVRDANLNRGANDPWSQENFRSLNIDGNQNEIYALIEKHGGNLDAAEAEYWQTHGTWFQRNISNPIIKHFDSGHIQSFRAENGLHITREAWSADLVYGHLDRISAYSYGGLGSVAHGYLEVSNVQRWIDMSIYGAWSTSY